MNKVVHVYLIFRKKGYAFGSLSAIFDHLEENEIGIKKNTLLHRAQFGTITTKKAIITKLTVLRRKKASPNDRKKV